MSKIKSIRIKDKNLENVLNFSKNKNLDFSKAVNNLIEIGYSYFLYEDNIKKILNIENQTLKKINIIEKILKQLFCNFEFTENENINNNIALNNLLKTFSKDRFDE